jgi:putative tryptophan/tyrosine transport system substrate-binding protein
LKTGVVLNLTAEGYVRRRDFIKVIAGSTAVWPLATRAQQPEMPVVGFLNSGSLANYVPMVAAFRQGLKEAGYVEGQNVAVEYRWAEGQYDRVPVIALELVDRRVAVLVANTPGVLAVKAAITTTPIVFTTAADPVQIGLVASMSRPAGNVTGATTLGFELASKRLELAHELVPTASVIAALINPANSSADPQVRDLQAAARTLGVQLRVVYASSERDFGVVFANLAELRPGALVIVVDSFFIGRNEQLAALAARHALPAISQERAFAAAGGLMSYGGSLPEMYRQAGIYTGRILKGEKPADLPVVQPTKFELIINLKAARALGLEVPPSLLGRADELIE